MVYFYHSDEIPLFLLTVFAKNEKANLTSKETQEIRQLGKLLLQTYGRKP